MFDLLLLGCRLLVGAFLRQGIFLASVNHELAEEVLEDEVREHGDYQNHEVVTAVRFGNAAEPGGERSKYEIEAEYLRHGDGYVGSRFEGEAAVESEVPKNRENQGNKIRNPIVLDKYLKNRKRAYLNNSCGD